MCDPVCKSENEKLFWEEYKKLVKSWSIEQILHRLQWDKAAISYLEKILEKKKCRPT